MLNGISRERAAIAGFLRVRAKREIGKNLGMNHGRKDGLMAFVDLVLLGDADGNTLSGGNGADTISGNDGDDILGGGGGNDILLGGKGFDYIRGGNGSDVLYGGSGDDYLFGGSGADYLSGDVGYDQLNGGQGADVFAFNVNSANLGMGIDLVHDFVVGEDLIKIVNGSISLVSFIDQGSSLASLIHDGARVSLGRCSLALAA